MMVRKIDYFHYEKFKKFLESEIKSYQQKFDQIDQGDPQYRAAVSGRLEGLQSVLDYAFPDS